MGISHQSLFHKLQGAFVISPHRFNTGQVIKAHLLLLAGPGGLIKSVKGFLRLPLIQKCKAQIVARF